MLVVVSGSFTLAFGADFTFQISGLGLSKCHSTLTPSIALGRATQEQLPKLVRTHTQPAENTRRRPTRTSVHIQACSTSAAQSYLPFDESGEMVTLSSRLCNWYLRIHSPLHPGFIPRLDRRTTPQNRRRALIRLRNFLQIFHKQTC